MASHRRGLSSSTSPRYNLRSNTNNGSSRSLNEGGARTLTDSFAVRKRPSVNSDSEDSSGEEPNKRIRKGNDQVVPGSKGGSRDTPLRQHRSSDILKRIPASPYGMFAVFSHEALLNLIDQVPVGGLTGLAISSRRFSELLKSYAASVSAKKRFAVEVGDELVDVGKQMTKADPFFAWGKLLKAVSISEHSVDRIECFALFHAKNNSTGNRAGWGRCMLAFVERWDLNDCQRLMLSLLSTTESGLFRQLSEVLEQPHGTAAHMEIKVRRGIRDLFLDHKFVNERDRPFWLSAVVRTQSCPEKRAKLLYLLYGQTKVNVMQQEVIDWHTQIEVPVTTMANSRERLGELSLAFSCLLMTKTIGLAHFTFSQTEVFNLLEEVTTSPRPWLFDNFASVLLNCPLLTAVAILYRVNRGYAEEAGQLFVAMQSLLYRWNVQLWSVLLLPVQRSMRMMTQTQRIALVGAIITAERQARMEAFNQLPGSREAFVTEMRASTEENRIVLYLATLI